MTINERIKFARKTLELTQIEFGNKVGISQGHLTSIENGKRSVTEKTLLVICATFGINEQWLRNGEGDIFVESNNTIISEIAAQYQLEEFDKELLRIFLELTPEQRKAVKTFAFSLIDSVLQSTELLQEYQIERTKNKLSTSLNKKEEHSSQNSQLLPIPNLTAQSYKPTTEELEEAYKKSHSFSVQSKDLPVSNTTEDIQNHKIAN